MKSISVRAKALSLEIIAQNAFEIVSDVFLRDIIRKLDENQCEFRYEQIIIFKIIIKVFILKKLKTNSF